MANQFNHSPISEKPVAKLVRHTFTVWVDVEVDEDDGLPIWSKRDLERKVCSLISALEDDNCQNTDAECILVEEL